MPKLKSPFENLDREDFRKIEEWLSLPDPTVLDATRILGVDAGYLKELLVLGPRIEVEPTRATRQLRLRYADGSVLNDVVDFILDELPQFPERTNLFELIPSPTPVPELAFGEDVIIAIVIQYDNANQSILEDIEKIMARAKRDAKEVVVDIDTASQQRSM